MNLVGLTFILKYLGLVTDKQSLAADGTFTGCTSATGDLAESCAPPADVEALLVEIEAATSDFTLAQTELANFVTDLATYRAACYGPGWTDNATGGSVNRPTGDLGMVATDLSATDTTACSAGQLTALLAGYPSFANDVLMFKGLLTAALLGAGSDINAMAVGESFNGTSVLPTITGFTPSAASISRYADTAEGYKVFYMTVTGIDGSGKDFDAYVYHVAETTDESAYSGVIKAVFPYTPTGGGGTNLGLSMVYNKLTDGTINYELRTAGNRTTDSEAFFNSAGVLDFSSAAFGEDGNIIRASMNSNTNKAVMHYAWQAGSSDGATRVFAISIPAGSAGALTGTAYAGYGAAVGSLAASPGDASIWATKFHCNWLNALGAGPSVSRVQKQSIAQDSTGKFVNSGTAQINFAPTNDCTKAGTWAISASNPSTYDNSARTAVATTDADFLTTYTANDIPAVTVTNPFTTLPSAP